jgi:hypothetical protein
LVQAQWLQAATQFTGLGLPVLVYLPNVPFALAGCSRIPELLWLKPRAWGLGDFFFAGVLAVQTFNKFGKKNRFHCSCRRWRWLSVSGKPSYLTLIKGLFQILGRNIGGFPGTLMIISGWAPVVAGNSSAQETKAANVPAVEAPAESSGDPNLPIQ